MKIERLVLKNFLSAQHSVFDFPQTTTLICGRNGSGKSQIHDALRIALQDKAPNARGVNAKTKIKTLLTRGAKEGFVEATVAGETYHRNLKTGNFKDPQPEINEFLPFLLHTKQFGSLPADHRRRFLMDLGGVSVEKNSITKELIARGCNPKMAEEVAPLLLGGFDGAQKYAKDKAREQKGTWAGKTGETWGAKKADTWVNTAATLPDDHNQQLEAVEKEIEALTVKAEFRGGTTAPCPWCCEEITYSSGEFTKAVEPKHDQSKVQPALRLAKDLRSELEQQKFLADNEQKTTDQAAEIHKGITEWLALADELSPEGVPRLVFDKAIKPINDRLAHWSKFFPSISIDSYAEIIRDDTVYDMCSESQQWLCDAMIAEAIAFQSGLRLLLLDRMDVLDLINRKRFVQWLGKLQADYDTIIVTATLKAAPKLPFCDSVWIENGRPVEQETG